MTSEPAIRILIAEDNELNRELAVRLLSKRGHDVTAVADGRAAVDAYLADRAAFDVILMDVQMPGLDGYGATRAIREAEAASPVRVPILALTAHAGRAEEARALEAGMDGYVEKPIDVSALLDQLAAVTGAGPVATAPAGDRDADAEPVAVIGNAARLTRQGADAAVLADMSRLLLDTADELLAGVRAAVRAADAASLSQSAHTLRGALANFGPGTALESATHLEALGRAGDLREADAALHVLEQRMVEVRAVLEERVRAGDA